MLSTTECGADFLFGYSLIGFLGEIQANNAIDFLTVMFSRQDWSDRYRSAKPAREVGTEHLSKLHSLLGGGGGGDTAQFNA